MLGLWMLIGLAASLTFGFFGGIRWQMSRTLASDDERFQQALKLWRSNKDGLDEVSQRNVTQLGSVRERLTALEQALSQNDACMQIEKLSQQIARLRDTCAAVNEENKQRDAQQTTKTRQPDPGNPSDKGFSEIISAVCQRVDSSTQLAELLDFVYEELRDFVPCQRMGYAEIDYPGDLVKAVWMRSERPARLGKGFSAPLSTSSLRLVAELKRPRLLNLRKFLRMQPDSNNTRLLVKEGFGASLTFPIVVDGTVTSFLFLNTIDPCGFDDDTIDRLSFVADQVSRMVAKTRTTGDSGVIRTKQELVTVES